MNIMKELEAFARAYPCLCAQNYPGSTMYHGHDCRNEEVQEFVAQFQDYIKLLEQELQEAYSGLRLGL